MNIKELLVEAKRRSESESTHVPAPNAEAPAVAKFKVGDRVVARGTVTGLDDYDEFVELDCGDGYSVLIKDACLHPEASQPAPVGDYVSAKEHAVVKAELETVRSKLHAATGALHILENRLRDSAPAPAPNIERYGAMVNADLRANLDLASSRLAEATNELAAKERELVRVRAERDEWRNKYHRREYK